MKKRNIPISIPATGQEEWEATRESFLSGWLTQGPKVTEFEKRFAERHGGKHALATSSCTTGLHRILAALGIGPGDEVVVSAFTRVATANVVLYCGAKPVFANVDTETNNISPTSLVDCLTDKTRAVIVVHLFGLRALMKEVRAVVPDHIKITEDAACAAVASFHDKPAGGLGKLRHFLFNLVNQSQPVKAEW